MRTDRTHIHIPVVALALAAAVVALALTPVASAATPSWYPQLHLAVIDVGDASAAVATCATPRAAKASAARSCSIGRASEEYSVLEKVSVFAETGEITGPCRRLLFKLDHTATTAAAKTLAFATPSTATVAKEVSGRRALAQAAKNVTADFTALQHCLGKA